jgi:hypothetical protein
MRLTPLCTLDLRYDGPFHLARPYGGESGLGWGVGDGTVSGARLSGRLLWSNHPERRGDGAMLPRLRGVITTAEDIEVFVEMSGRTVFDDAGGQQMLFATFESEDPTYAWLNTVVCVGDGRIHPGTLEMRIEISMCEPQR